MERFVENGSGGAYGGKPDGPSARCGVGNKLPDDDRAIVPASSTQCRGMPGEVCALWKPLSPLRRFRPFSAAARKGPPLPRSRHPLDRLLWAELEAIAVAG